MRKKLYKDKVKCPSYPCFLGSLLKCTIENITLLIFMPTNQGLEGLFEIQSGKLIEGKFPPKACKIIKEWSFEHQKELLEDWDLAQKGKQLLRIPGADQ